ncbi:hypothetical protein ABIB57_004253 [Devosia sp. UYZn731]
MGQFWVRSKWALLCALSETVVHCTPQYPRYLLKLRRKSDVLEHLSGAIGLRIKKLLTLSQGRTTIVIAHRLSTVRHANRIMVLTPNGVGEEGTHEQLMQHDGLYAGLHKVSTSF